MTNVVVICTDQWRADCFSAVDNGSRDIFGATPQTPFLDDIASQGTVFERAYSPAPTCVPARRSLLTGLSPANHGLVGYKDGIPLPKEPTVAKCFSEAGFQTQAIGKLHVWPERANAGFDNVILHDGYLHHARKGRRDVRFYDDYTTWINLQPGSGFTDEYENGVHCNAVFSRPWERPEYQHPTNWITTEAINWLYRRDPTRPFFLFLSYHRPHAPYNPPEWAWDIYDNMPLNPISTGDWENTYLNEYMDSISPQAHVAKYSEGVRLRALRGYYGNISHIDAQIERFMEAMNDFQLAKDTVFCFTSDHGDMLGEHNIWRKGFPYEGSARIPIFFWGKDIPRGIRVTNLTDLCDLMPTLLELVGVDIPDNLDGISQARVFAKMHKIAEKNQPDLIDKHIELDLDSNSDQEQEKEQEPDISSGNSITDDESTEYQTRQFLHGEHIILGQSLQWVITDNYKYIWWSNTGREQIFNLATDPHELHDLLLEETRITAKIDAITNKIRQYLLQVISSRPEGFVQKSALVSNCKVSATISVSK